MLADRVRMCSNRGSGKGIKLEGLPLYTIVTNNFLWEYRDGDNYSGEGVVAPVSWILVAKNHNGFPADSITLITEGYIARGVFDNSTDRGNAYGTNSWEDSGSPNATFGIRKFLNETFYYSMPLNFKNAILTTDLINLPYNSDTPYYTQDKVFIASQEELGKTHDDLKVVGLTLGGMRTRRKVTKSIIPSIELDRTNYWCRNVGRQIARIGYISNISGTSNNSGGVTNSGWYIRAVINVSKNYKMEVVE